VILYQPGKPSICLAVRSGKWMCAKIVRATEFDEG
jgi:hypothetical protein